jgi:hypothetical protein
VAPERDAQSPLWDFQVSKLPVSDIAKRYVFGFILTVLAIYVDSIAKRLIGQLNLCTEVFELELQQNFPSTPHLNACFSTLRKLSHAGETTPEPHHNPPLPTMPSTPPRDSYLPLGLEC